MYSACLWCHRPLGRNDTLEAFPVGRRLAFDEAKGRLWVVCPACERWNLTPLEERGAVIEDCERLFRATRTRVATDHIGLARLKDGLELVRIGAPQRPEFAAWRYGDQFGRRRLRNLAVVSAGAAAVGAVVAGLAWLSGGVLVGTGLWGASREMALRGRTATTLDFNGRRERVSLLLADRTRIQRTADLLRVAVPRSTSATNADRAPDLGGQLGLDEPQVRAYAMPVSHHRHEWDIVEGAMARDVLARLLPAVNRAGGTKEDVADAVRRSERMDGDRATAALRAVSGRVKPLHDLDVTTRLMLEMALHEDDERRWLEGELHDLETRWRDAEALAAIADRLGRSAS